jgi:ATP-dependent RNA circularization protein (DNA/RNA ligase family)
MSDASWHSYSKIYALGHRATRELMDGPVVVEEKIDGSQFSFGVFGGEVRVRSRGRVFDVQAPDGMFVPVCETILGLAGRGLLRDGWTYRGETLQKPRHNALTYGRVPEGHIILFDIETDLCSFLPPDEKKAEADRLGLEVVPTFFEGVIGSQEQLDKFKGIPSCLGGANAEGFVVKAYDKFSPDKKVLMGKWVSEAFKEVHRKTWKMDNPTKYDIIEQIVKTYNTEARWRKAVQHLTEDGKLLGEPKDIAALIKEIQADVKKDAEEEIKQALFDFAWKKINRGIVRGFPEWYKQELMEGLFNE